MPELLRGEDTENLVRCWIKIENLKENQLSLGEPIGGRSALDYEVKIFMVHGEILVLEHQYVGRRLSRWMYCGQKLAQELNEAGIVKFEKEEVQD